MRGDMAHARLKDAVRWIYILGDPSIGSQEFWGWAKFGVTQRKEVQGIVYSEEGPEH